MVYTIPNEAAAFNVNQAEVDTGDVQILVDAHASTGVVSGCAVTAQGTPDMTVAVASGTIGVAGSEVAVTSGNVTITAADSTNPRFDLVVVNSSGVKSVTAGTAATEPIYPAIPASSVVLAAVYVPATDTTIESNQIIDKRVLLHSTLVGPISINRSAVGTLLQGFVGTEAQPRIRVQTDRYEWRTGGAATTGMDLRRQSISTLDFVRDATAAPTIRGRIESDTQPRWNLTGSVLSMGPGGATAPDVSLTRTAANEWLLGAEDSLAFQAKAADPTLPAAGSFIGQLYSKELLTDDPALFWQNATQVQQIVPVTVVKATDNDSRFETAPSPDAFRSFIRGPLQIEIGSAIGTALGDIVQRLVSFATNDDPQEEVRQNRVATTDATVTTLHTIAIPASTTVQIIAYVQARRTGGTAGTAEDAASFVIVATVKNVAGTATQVGTSPILSVTHNEALNPYLATIDVNAANARVRVTGAVNNNITWHCTVRVLPVGT